MMGPGSVMCISNKLPGSSAAGLGTTLWGPLIHGLSFLSPPPPVSHLLRRYNPHLAACCCHSVTKLCPILCNPMHCNKPGFPVLHYLPEFSQTHVHWVGDAIQPSHPLCPFVLLLSIFPSIRVFSNESALHIWRPKHWSFSISPSSEYSGLISFGIDWFDFLTIQGTLRSLLQHHSSKASILQRSVFLTV